MNGKHGKVTMKDVAALAGVTTQTVSRALGDNGTIKEETKARILEIARKIGYVKNLSAATLRVGRAKMIAVFYDNMRNVYFPIMTDYLQYYLQKNGYHTMIISQREKRLGVNLFSIATSQNVAGIITFLEPDDELMKLDPCAKTPMLLVGRQAGAPNIDCIKTDDKMGGKLVGEELLRFGCKDILYVSESFDISCAKERYEGLVSAVGEGVRLLDVSSGKPLFESFDEMKATGTLPDGVFCFNDVLGNWVCKWYETAGIPLPKLIGYDQTSKEIPQPFAFPSVGVDKSEMAKRAVEALLARINDKNKEYQTIIMPVYFSDEATAKP